MRIEPNMYSNIVSDSKKEDMSFLTVPKLEFSVEALGKHIPVYKSGSGNLPLLIVGPASLFKKPKFLPADFENIFTIYYVDLFENEQSHSENLPLFQLHDFTDALESIRIQLGYNKIVLFGHSASGVLAIEYSRQYPDCVLFNVLVCTAPVWGEAKRKLVNSYFDSNSTEERKKLFKSDQEQLEYDSSKGNKSKSSFIAQYNARRAHFFYKPELTSWSTLWDNLNLDEELINLYFSLISNYDFAKLSSNYKTPTFLALGMYDYSCPFYSWTDEMKKQLIELGDKVEYYIFAHSGHYPHMEEEIEFCDKLRKFVMHHSMQFQGASSNSQLNSIVLQL